MALPKGGLRIGSAVARLEVAAATTRALMATLRLEGDHQLAERLPSRRAETTVSTSRSRKAGSISTGSGRQLRAACSSVATST